MKKAYVNPEVKVLSLNVEDTTNIELVDQGKDDITLSIGGSELGGLFG